MYGTAYCANYAGTKAYNLIIAESLWYELGRHGVDVLGFMAGSTKTPGWDANAPKPNRFVKVMDVKSTVTEALQALARDRMQLGKESDHRSNVMRGSIRT